MLNWFPSSLYTVLYAIVFFGVALIDSYVIKRVTPQSSRQYSSERDRSSYRFIHLAGLLAIFSGITCRYQNWMIAPAWVQWLALAAAAFGLAFRDWAIITLGRNFSRMVEIQAGQRLITTGPYRRFRHPAYTGMVLMYVGLALALGSWIGGFLAAVLILAATLYRIRVEEAVLIEAFGDEYKQYMQHTWMLFPGW